MSSGCDSQIGAAILADVTYQTPKHGAEWVHKWERYGLLKGLQGVEYWKTAHYLEAVNASMNDLITRVNLSQSSLFEMGVLALVRRINKVLTPENVWSILAEFEVVAAQPLEFTPYVDVEAELMWSFCDQVIARYEKVAHPGT
jgi:hypothetical protein